MATRRSQRNKLEKGILAALNKLRKEHGPEFQASAQTITDAVDLNPMPTKTTIYRVTKEMADSGTASFTITPGPNRRTPMTISFKRVAKETSTTPAGTPVVAELQSTLDRVFQRAEQLVAENRNLKAQIENLQGEVKSAQESELKLRSWVQEKLGDIMEPVAA